MKIGIIGGGQLGRMIALAGFPLGHQFRIWTDSRDLATSEIADQIIGPFHDPGLVARFCEGLDAVTYEWENVPVPLAKEISSRVPYFFPNPSVLEVIQDRLEQKSFFKKLKIPTAPFVPVQSQADLTDALKNFKSAVVLKTCLMGYDGKGQVMVKSLKEVDAAWNKLGQHHLIAEGFIKFETEVSLIAARSTRGEICFYPLLENIHHEGVLRTTYAPARFSSSRLKRLQREAEKIARSLLNRLNYVGVMTIEFFLFNGSLLVNEIASRVHNSGHFSIEGCATSQFENHLRAGLGLPLGDPQMLKPTAMINILGQFPDHSSVFKIRDAHYHHYGKSEQAKRKIGHITVRADSLRELEVKVRKVQSLMKTSKS